AGGRWRGRTGGPAVGPAATAGDGRLAHLAADRQLAGRVPGRAARIAFPEFDRRPVGGPARRGGGDRGGPLPAAGSTGRGGGSAGARGAGPGPRRAGGRRVVVRQPGRGASRVAPVLGWP